MTETETNSTEAEQTGRESAKPEEEQLYYYRIRFREQGQEFTVQSKIPDLVPGNVVIARTDHGPEPARIIVRAPRAPEPGMPRRVSFVVTRRATREEEEKYGRLPQLEKDAYRICARLIAKLKLPMQLIQVERFFNGSKIIFYFTAESRVDFRELVKKLVQEFRTRVEMRQIGVRHETQLIGGIGACGRELCCSSFLKKFDSVSIKMAKTQDLPLNPAKISGLCNRLLCCLTYEYDSYRTIKRDMPRVGKLIEFEGTTYKVQRLSALQGTLQAVSQDGEEVVLTEEQWREARPVKPTPPKGQKNKK